MKQFFLAFVLSVTALAADRSIQLNTGNTKIEWTLTDPLHTVHGTFKLKSGSITFDTDSGKASGEVVVDVRSGESGSGASDSRMHANVLESAKFPEAVFRPDHVEGKFAPEGVSTLALHGTFQIHGAAHEVTVKVQSVVTAVQRVTDITFDIPYVAWGMKDPSNFLLKVSKSVQMAIHTTAVPQP